MEKEMQSISVPPVKIGDTAFFVINGQVFEATVCFMQWICNRYGVKSEIRGECPGGSVSASFDDWGKTLFSNREELTRYEVRNMGRKVCI